MAAGLCAEETILQEILPHMRAWIELAIKQGIAAGVQQTFLTRRHQTGPNHSVATVAKQGGIRSTSCTSSGGESSNHSHAQPDHAIQGRPNRLAGTNRVSVFPRQ
uniref:Uncharacterized protein n=1 Tax=Micrurus lemniscatus lemniscatus TaxID=129467 RepID=A0A2D4JGH6_MICLE